MLHEDEGAAIAAEASPIARDAATASAETPTLERVRCLPRLAIDEAVAPAPSERRPASDGGMTSPAPRPGEPSRGALRAPAVEIIARLSSQKARLREDLDRLRSDLSRVAAELAVVRATSPEPLPAEAPRPAPDAPEPHAAAVAEEELARARSELEAERRAREAADAEARARQDALARAEAEADERAHRFADGEAQALARAAELELRLERLESDARSRAEREESLGAESARLRDDLASAKAEQARLRSELARARGADAKASPDAAPRAIQVVAFGFGPEALAAPASASPATRAPREGALAKPYPRLSSRAERLERWLRRTDRRLARIEARPAVASLDEATLARLERALARAQAHEPAPPPRPEPRSPSSPLLSGRTPGGGGMLATLLQQNLSLRAGSPARAPHPIDPRRSDPPRSEGP